MRHAPRWVSLFISVEPRSACGLAAAPASGRPWAAGFSAGGCLTMFARRDASGVDVALAARPGRIVSLIPSITELLFALGLDARIVGVTRF